MCQTKGTDIVHTPLRSVVIVIQLATIHLPLSLQ